MERIDMTVSKIKETLKQLAEDDPPLGPTEARPAQGCPSVVRSAEVSLREKGEGDCRVYAHVHP